MKIRVKYHQVCKLFLSVHKIYLNHLHIYLIKALKHKASNSMHDFTLMENSLKAMKSSNAEIFTQRENEDIESDKE